MILKLLYTAILLILTITLNIPRIVEIKVEKQKTKVVALIVEGKLDENILQNINHTLAYNPNKSKETLKATTVILKIPSITQEIPEITLKIAISEAMRKAKLEFREKVEETIALLPTPNIDRKTMLTLRRLGIKYLLTPVQEGAKAKIIVDPETNITAVEYYKIKNIKDLNQTLKIDEKVSIILVETESNKTEEILKLIRKMVEKGGIKVYRLNDTLKIALKEYQKVRETITSGTIGYHIPSRVAKLLQTLEELEYRLLEKNASIPQKARSRILDIVVNLESYVKEHEQSKLVKALEELNQTLKTLKITLLKSVKTWIYILQSNNIKTKQLLNINVDLIVLDPDDFNLTRSKIEEFKRKGKIVIAYLSIGEAEKYRSYWRKTWKPGKPEWLDGENPEWKGCYLVKYWHREWQEIIIEKAKEIISRGYDGLYLDRADAYLDWEEKGYSKKQLRIEMVKFIVKIKSEVEKLNPATIIIVQNALELLDYKQYINIIDGIGKEDTWYQDNKPRPRREVEYDLKYLLKAKSNGKIILVIDYITDINKIRDFFNKAQTHGFIPYVGPKSLDKIGYYKKP